MTNRLTERAKDALFNVSHTKNTSIVSANSVISSLKKAGGVGSYILGVNPNIVLKKESKLNINSLVEKAFYFSVQLGHVYVGTEHILLSLLDLVGSPDVEDIKIQIKNLNTFPNLPKVTENMSKTPILDAFCTNLTKSVTRLIPSDKLLARSELDLLMTVLLQKNNPNALIVGDFGVGRKSLIHLLAQKITDLEVPISLSGYQVIEFDIMSFIASLSGRENIDSTINTFVEELDSLGDVILYIKDFQGLFLSTGAGYVTPLAFSLLKSYLTAAGISTIGVMSTNFYNKISEDSIGIFNDFDEIFLDEPSDQLILKIMFAKSKSLGYYHNIEIPQKIINYTFEKSKEFLKEMKFPGKGIYILDQACAKLLVSEDIFPKEYKNLIEKKEKLLLKYDSYLDSNNLNKAIDIKTKLSAIDLSLGRIRTENTKMQKLNLIEQYVDGALVDIEGTLFPENKVDLNSLSNLAKSIKKRIVGQDSAVEVVSKALIRSRLGLRPKKRPLGNFLFLGPTGVGKTELAKVLATEGFGEDSLIRLDMSDFSEKHNVARLVGAPPGYVGFGEGGELTSKIDSKPDSVVLFDEIEKAHPDVLNILLQIMEEGELKDAKGQTFDFSRAVIILTSNLGTEIVLKESVGFNQGKTSNDNIEDRLKLNLKKILKPELLNRFDEIVVFKKLTKPSHKKILNILLSEISNTLKKQNISIKISNETKKYLIEKGYSDEYGARSLRRVIEKELLDKIAEYLLTDSSRPLSIKITFEHENIHIS